MMEFEAQLSKARVRDALRFEIEEAGLKISDEDFERPWGGFFLIADESMPGFAHRYFPEPGLVQLHAGHKLSPKILVVAPKHRLSWQVHHRRAELWKILAGPVGVLTSLTDDEPKLVPTYVPGDILQLALGTRHRLVGLERWGVIAEIWQHSNFAHPSDEEDIRRIQDDYGR